MNTGLLTCSCRKCGSPLRVPYDPDGMLKADFIASAVICNTCADKIDQGNRAAHQRHLEQDRNRRSAAAELRRAKAGDRSPYADD